MTRLAIELGLGALVAWMLSDAMGWNFFVTAGALGVVYLLIRGRHLLTGLGASAPRGGGIGLGNLPVNVVVWLGIMLLGTAVIAFSNVEAFIELVKIGWRPWLWPADAQLKFLLWICLAFIAGSAATPNASPRPWARLIFGLGFVLLFTILWMPQQAEAIRPRPVSPAVSPSGGSPSKWDEAEKAAAEIGDIPVIFCLGWQKAFGPLGYCTSGKTVGTVLGDSLGAAVGAIKGAVGTSDAAAQTAPVVEYPTSGEGHATKTMPIKAYLDPKRTFTRPSGPARYVFAEDSSLFFDDVTGHVVDRTENRKIWQDMPEGKYLVEPLHRGDIFFRWYQ